MTKAILCGLLLLCGLAARPAKAEAPDFNRDVRPILSQNCFKCHGPDDSQRQAGLRLDSRAGALARLASGHSAVVAGRPAASVLVKRVFSTGADRMPPAYANKALTPQQKDVLRRWVAAGANYSPHWAFVAPVQRPLPKVKLASWPRNPIDRFVLARMERAGLRPSPEADRYTLVRRVYLDLIGLPPTVAEADAFVSDRRPNAYERMVDRLLASPRYGERWARRWLDLARYADTNGFEKDRPRSVWLYRDWVIDALNRDMPFDQFTIEQLAGDMLPNATIEQKVATGFNRNTMLNEEGGIDPLEYRFYSMVDRVATTGTTWLGLTIGCAQCHTHKFDPITQREYYRTMACLDNADEITLDVPRPELAEKRKKIEAEITTREAGLADKFPVGGKMQWRPARIAEIKTESGAKATQLPDGSVLVSGVNPEKDAYTISLADGQPAEAVRIEALPDPSLGGGGPGRTPHGNFVLTRIAPQGGPLYNPISRTLPRFIRAEADFSQDGFPASAALDGAGGRGWAVDGPGQLGKPHTATFTLDRPLRFSGGSQWLLRLEQSYGGHHTLGRFRISLGTAASPDDARPVEVRRQEALQRSFAAWTHEQETRAVHWRILRPETAKSNLPLLTVQDDGSVFVSGDTTKRDVYDLAFKTDGAPITAIRLEAMPDDRLPGHGPGRTFYEGGFGDFYLSEISLAAGGSKAKFASASQSGGSPASAAIDGDPQSGWSINGRQGEATIAVFRLANPVKADSFSLQLLFERYFASALGRFRISFTSDSHPAQADLPADAEEALLVPVAQRSAVQNSLLLAQFLQSAPELQPERDAIAMLKRQVPAYPNALVFQERPASNTRPTFVHHRGEYLQTEERVTPGVPAVLPGPAATSKLDRLGFARWLVSRQNPLTARVAVNRQWASFFGRGIVQTLQDFGYQGSPPTHPELLDWLAASFMSGQSPPASLETQRHRGDAEDSGVQDAAGSPARAIQVRGHSKIQNPGARVGGRSKIQNGLAWSMKRLHRLIVTSATYRQSSRVTPELVAKDPENLLLARGPRVRLEAEMLRDSVLTASGLLSAKIGGPSVFPPQPAGVTSEGTYGPLAWNVSQGEDRYRRGLYTFSKRTAPYAMFTTFDAPTGEVCVARREVSDTPLQALTLLNDQVFVEAAQALGRLIIAQPGSDEARADTMFRRCLTRPPKSNEADVLLAFFRAQRQRFESKELNAAQVAGPGEGDVNARAAWTTAARSLLNLDEAVTKR